MLFHAELNMAFSRPEMQGWFWFSLFSLHRSFFASYIRLGEYTYTAFGLRLIQAFEQLDQPLDANLARDFGHDLLTRAGQSGFLGHLQLEVFFFHHSYIPIHLPVHFSQHVSTYRDGHIHHYWVARTKQA